MILIHDLSHVMTGYGTDDIGEATLLGFNLAQTGGRANAFLTLGAAVETWRHLRKGWPSYLVAAWRRGRRAEPLIELPWEDLLPLPLETVREIACIERPEVTHPRGIWAKDLPSAAH
jgi:ubiquinone biosynthesis protein COQ4